MVGDTSRGRGKGKGEMIPHFFWYKVTPGIGLVTQSIINFHDEHKH